MKLQFLSFSFQKRFHLALLGAGGLFLFFLVFLPVSRVQAITISPPRLELAGDPGQTISGEFKVKNDGTEYATYYTQVENFEAGDESGNPVFVPTREGLATWVKVQPSISAPVRDEIIVPFTIQIPRNVEPGGYFASIFVRNTPPPTNTNEVSIGARLGTLLLLRVNGEMREGVSILEFSSENKQRMFTSLPVEFYYRFQNTGADRVRPEGEIVVKNIIGLTAKLLNSNPTEGSVLPRSIRRFETTWLTGGGGKQDADLEANPDIAGVVNQPQGGFFSQAKSQLSNFAFGYYTANLDIRYGENNNTAKAKFSFFIIPWQLLTIVVISLLVLLFVARFILRRYNNYIIRSHQRR